MIISILKFEIDNFQHVLGIIFHNNDFVQLEWLKCHATTSDNILVIANGASYIIEHKLHLENSKLKEIRYKGRGIIKLTLVEYNKIILLR